MTTQHKTPDPKPTGRPKLHPDLKRDCPLTVNVTRAELALIKNAAGITPVSTFVYVNAIRPLIKQHSKGPEYPT